MKKFKIESFIVSITWLNGIVHGFGNGYVAIPKGHPLYGKDYDNISLDVHGGLTFSQRGDENPHIVPQEYKDHWIIGF